MGKQATGCVVYQAGLSQCNGLIRAQSENCRVLIIFWLIYIGVEGDKVRIKHISDVTLEAVQVNGGYDLVTATVHSDQREL